jgi:hypothetical protein
MSAIEQRRETVIQRFVAACRSDERVVAAFLGGSYAREMTDAYSNLDFGLITTDEAYDDLFAGHQAFIGRLGQPVFLEVFGADNADGVCFTFTDGVEGELVLGRQSQFTYMHVGPVKVLHDPTGLLAEAIFPLPQVGERDQCEVLRRIILWFWHDLDHHILTPLARGHLWSAYGGLEELRLVCVNLTRLRENFQAPLAGYRHIEQAVGAEQLAPLAATCCALDRRAMLQATRLLVRCYQELALPLAHRYRIAYPADIERVILGRLERLREMM